jgi:hypothetical protein
MWKITLFSMTSAYTYMPVIHQREHKLFVSSPGHEVVKVRYSDGAMSGVRHRASFVVNNWLVNTLVVTVLIGSSSNFVRMFVSMKYHEFKFEDGSSLVKNYVTGAKNRKSLLTL